MNEPLFAGHFRMFALGFQPNKLPWKMFLLEWHCWCVPELLMKGLWHVLVKVPHECCIKTLEFCLQHGVGRWNQLLLGYRSVLAMSEGQKMHSVMKSAGGWVIIHYMNDPTSCELSHQLPAEYYLYATQITSCESLRNPHVDLVGDSWIFELRCLSGLSGNIIIQRQNMEKF